VPISENTSKIRFISPIGTIYSTFYQGEYNRKYHIIPLRKWDIVLRVFLGGNSSVADCEISLDFKSKRSSLGAERIEAVLAFRADHQVVERTHPA
jgi:hypothetical protein